MLELYAEYGFITLQLKQLKQQNLSSKDNSCPLNWAEIPQRKQTIKDAGAGTLHFPLIFNNISCDHSAAIFK